MFSDVTWFAFQKAKCVGARGQVVVEYVLLLIVAVSLALLMTRMMVRRDPADPGFVIRAWQQILNEVAQDQPEGQY